MEIRSFPNTITTNRMLKFTTLRKRAVIWGEFGTNYLVRHSFQQVGESRTRRVQTLRLCLVLSAERQQLEANVPPSPPPRLLSLSPRESPHLRHGLRALLRFTPDIHRTFPGSSQLAHLWGNYTQRFVVLIDLLAQFLCVVLPLSSFVRYGPRPYLLTFLTPSLSRFTEECTEFPVIVHETVSFSQYYYNHWWATFPSGQSKPQGGGNAFRVMTPMTSAPPVFWEPLWR